MHSLSTETYSATVDLKLHIDGQVIDVAQTNHESIILREVRELPAGPAQLVMTIDGHRETYDIVLQPEPGKAAKEIRYG